MWFCNPPGYRTSQWVDCSAKTRVFCAFWLTNVLCATAACHFSRSKLQKLVRECGVLRIFTCKCASRHSGVPFFGIHTSKILTCKYTSRHSGVPFLWNAFSQHSAMPHFKPFRLDVAYAALLEFQKLFRKCRVLRILTCKCASRHVPFFIFLLNSYFRTCRCSEPNFRTSGTTNHWKNTAICDFPNICRMCIFFLVTLLACWSFFFWLDFSTLLFNCPYCRKLGF